MPKFKDFCSNGHRLSETRVHDGRRYRCRSCGIESIKKWHEENPHKKKEIQAARTPQERRAEHLRRHWRLTLEEVGGVCHLCGSVTAGSLHVDHDHSTGVIRGFLCRPCNTGIGMLKDNPALLRLAAEYLELSAWRQGGYDS